MTFQGLLIGRDWVTRPKLRPYSLVPSTPLWSLSRDGTGPERSRGRGRGERRDGVLGEGPEPPGSAGIFFLMKEASPELQLRRVVDVSSPEALGPGAGSAAGRQAGRPPSWEGPTRPGGAARERLAGLEGGGSGARRSLRTARRRRPRARSTRASETDWDSRLSFPRNKRVQETRTRRPGPTVSRTGDGWVALPLPWDVGGARQGSETRNRGPRLVILWSLPLLRVRKTRPLLPASVRRFCGGGGPG